MTRSLKKSLSLRKDVDMKIKEAAPSTSIVSAYTEQVEAPVESDETSTCYLCLSEYAPGVESGTDDDWIQCNR